MATYENFKIFLIGAYLLLFVGCHSVTEDELSGAGLAPDPVFEPSRTMVLTPTALPEGQNRVQFVWAGSLIDNIIFNYLQFAQSIPGNISNVEIKNASDIWDFYGADDPSPKKQAELIKKTLDDNKAHWIMVMPEKDEEIQKRYAIPDRLSLTVVRGKETPLYYFDKKMIVIQSSLDTQMNLNLTIYDSLSSKSLAETTMHLPLKAGLGTMEDQAVIAAELKPQLKKILEDITSQKMFEVSLPSISKDLGVYAEGKLVIEPDFFLAQGKHRVFVSQVGNILTQGIVDIQKDGKLDLEEALKKQKGSPLKIKTDPAHTPLFIDEQYIGLSPIEVTLPAGEYYLRTSLKGHAHINYILSIDPTKPIRDLELDLPLIDQAYEERLQLFRRVKLGTFFSGIMGIGALIYSYGRASFYQQKISQGVDVSLSRRRYNEFFGATIGFGALSTGLLLTSAIFQLLEYQARDVGIGVSEDGNLGVVYHF